ncbi:helix-turn-helix domain-containing protein [Jiella marina]|uniref:helix-turn-helix domain-containing protein n=1 Tax=Jiella sp. LLJ827 TaxID=2917712 RepID=UPI0021008C41|nr:helix-turn-helix domain-containing protein [Jiella sp. LLJ827]MCQ0987328.1 helix-turn-helix domain-containing protein [Jiella sp. LLJ827]
MGMMPGPQDTDTLGGRIQKTRDALGLSTGALARRIGVRPETMRGWERDRAEPKSAKLVELAGVLGVSPAWLMGGVGETRDAELVEPAAIEAKIALLRERRAAIDDEIQKLEVLKASSSE